MPSLKNELPVEEKRAMSLEEFAERWSIGRNSVYNAIARGDLDSIKVGNRRVITLEQEEAFRQRLEAKSA